MKKTTKGALAAGGAAILLIGGGSTIAYWNSAADVDAGQVSTGHLNIVPSGGPGAWTDVTGGGEVPITDIAAFNLVPGDTIAYSQEFMIEAEGDNLVADITATVPAPNPEIDGWITTMATIGGAPAQITDAQDDSTVTVDVEVVFDPAAPGQTEAGENAADDAVVDLSELQIVLQQVQGTAGGN